jgi:hypothetical protein
MIILVHIPNNIAQQNLRIIPLVKKIKGRIFIKAGCFEASSLLSGINMPEMFPTSQPMVLYMTTPTRLSQALQTEQSITPHKLLFHQTRTSNP